MNNNQFHELKQLIGALDDKINDVRQDMHQETGKVSDQVKSLRQEVTDQVKDLRLEMHERADGLQGQLDNLTKQVDVEFRLVDKRFEGIDTRFGYLDDSTSRGFADSNKTNEQLKVELTDIGTTVQKTNMLADGAAHLLREEKKERDDIKNEQKQLHRWIKQLAKRTDIKLAPEM